LRLQAQQEAVVETLQVVDPVGVDDRRVGQRAELEQTLEVRVGARQPRDLQAEDRTHLAQADPPDQLLVPLPRLRVATGDPQIAVDDEDPLVLPAELGRLVRERVLTLGRADVEPHLRG